MIDPLALLGAGGARCTCCPVHGGRDQRWAMPELVGELQRARNLEVTKELDELLEADRLDTLCSWCGSTYKFPGNPTEGAYPAVRNECPECGADSGLWGESFEEARSDQP